MYMLFEQEKIKVRQLQPEDKHFLVNWLSNPSVLEYYETSMGCWIW